MNEAPTAPFVQAQAEILGQDHSYPMIAYGTMKKSAAWKLYAKSQDIPFEIANAVSDQIKRYELAVKHADDDEKDSIDINKFISKQYTEIYEKSKEYDGLISSWSIAPCSSLIYQGSIRREVGLVKVKDNICCLMDGHWAESGHFLKNDHLKVSVVDLIYKGFHSIGMEPPKVKELLKMCPPDDPAWEVFERGCTMGINQCEQEGTRARIMKYKPKNISELSAFVAAIRPGGASFYKKFESREPFSYGVKTFDDLIQTKEFPYSFLLYQEQIMRALNYAGIEMSECYTAIKNIAKKRVEKVLAYQGTFVKGFSEAIMRDEGKSKEEADQLAAELWKVIEDSAGYSFNASHSYCVAIDSLYGAWLKAHHPAEFYVTYITLMEEKGDKDKIAAAREEAESYFNVRFAPFKYGQDNRYIHASKDGKEIINTIGSIKGYGVTVGRALYNCSKVKCDTFLDVLNVLDSAGVKLTKVRPLIKIDYFSQFGNQAELFEIARLWEFFDCGQAINIRRSNVGDANTASVIEKYANYLRKDGKESVFYTFPDHESTWACMRELQDYIMDCGMEDLPWRIKVVNSIDVVGYCNIKTNREEDRKKLVITEMSPLRSKDKGEIWAYRLSTKSLGSGKSARVTVKNSLYERNPINVYDIVDVKDLYKNNAGYWYLTDYIVE